MQVKKQQLELTVEQWAGSELGREYIKPVYCHPACLTDMQNHVKWRAGWAWGGIKVVGRSINNLR